MSRYPPHPRAQRPGQESVWDYRYPVSARREALKHLMRRPSPPPEPRWGWVRRLWPVTGGAR